jgi:hypothetical protein
MPNTLVHLGVQGLATRAAWRGADLAWIYVGCVIPDLPWILRRAVPALVPSVNLLDWHMHTAVQATLVFCLILSAAVAVLARDSRRVFLLLGATSLAHLLLDTVEIKWGNGVHLLAPFSWRLSSLGWIWPESGWIHALTALGLAAVLFQWRAASRGPSLMRRPAFARVALAVALAAAWLALPAAWVGALEASGMQDAATLRDRDHRTGRPVVLDRVPLVRGEAVDYAVAIDGGRIALEGFRAGRDGLISVRGLFTAPDRVRVDEVRVHPAGLRDLQTVAGLALAAAVVALRLVRRPDGEGACRAA